MWKVFGGILLLIVLTAPSTAFAQRSVWVAVMVIYQAPSDAIDWRGPWTRSEAFVNPCPYRLSHPGVLVVQAAQKWDGHDLSNRVDRPA
jgi:hypothetical protein